MKTRDNAANTGVEDDVKRIVAVITPVAGLVASVLGALAGYAGGFTRTIRNEPHLVWLAAATLLIGFFYTAWAFFRYPGNEPASQADRTRSLSIALFAFGLAFIFGVLATVRTIHDPQAPGIALAWNADASTADATVSARNLRTEMRVSIAIFGESRDSDGVAELWRSVTAGDADGSVSLPASASIDRSEHDSVLVKAWTGDEEPACDGSDQGPSGGLSMPWDPPDPLWACASMSVPPAGGPLIDVKVDTATNDRRLIGSVTGTFTGGERLILSVASVDDGRALYRSEIPSAHGSTTVPISVQLGDVDAVCVAAITTDRGDDFRIESEDLGKCPPATLTPGAAVTWVLLGTPVAPASVPNTASPSPSP